MKSHFSILLGTNTTSCKYHAFNSQLALSAFLFAMLFLIPFSELSAQIQWKERYICIATNDQIDPSIARPKNDDYTVVVWQDQRSDDGDIYIEKIDNDHGISLWNTPDGKPVCTATGSQERPRAAYDSCGGIIVAWEDWRNGQPEIFAQRVILSTGELDPNWTSGNPDGLPICSGISSARSPRIVGSGDGAYIGWVDSRSGSMTIYLQFVTFSAGISWASNGIAAANSTTSNQTNFEMASDQYWRTIGTDTRTGVVVVYEDDRSGNTNIFASARKRDGSLSWGDVAVDAVNAPQYTPQLESTRLQHDGYILVWQDSRNGDYDVRASVIDRSGAVTWAGNSLLVSNYQSNQEHPRMTLIEGSSTYPYVVVAWEDDRNGNADIFANQINIVARTLNSNAGTAIAAENQTQNHVWVDSYFDNSDYHAVIVWEDFRSTLESDIFVQDITVPSWTLNDPSGGRMVTHAKSNQAHPEAAGDIVIWQDARRKGIPYENSADENIYAQKLGTAPCDEPTVMRWRDVFTRWSNVTDAENFKFAVDDSAETGSGGASYVVWNEERQINQSESIHGVFIQKIDSTGCPRWKNNGVLLSDTTALATHPDVCKDGTGGAMVVWMQKDYGNNDNHIMIAQVNAAGRVMWRYEPLISGSRISGENHDPAIVPLESTSSDDGAWYGFINGDDVYLGAIQKNGSFYVNYDEPSSRSGGHKDLKMCQDYLGGAYLLTRNGGEIKMSHALDPDGYDESNFIVPITRSTYTNDDSFFGYDLACDPAENNYADMPNHDALISYVDQIAGALSDIVAIRFSSENGSWWYKAPYSLSLNNNADTQTPGNARYPAIDAYALPNQAGLVGGAMVSWDLETVNAPIEHQVQTNGVTWDYTAGSWGASVVQWSATSPVVLEPGIDRFTYPDIGRIRHLDPFQNGPRLMGLTVWINGEMNCAAVPQVRSMLVDYNVVAPGNPKRWSGPHPVSLSATFSTQSHPIVKTNNTTSGDVTDSPAWIFWLDSRTGMECITGTRVFSNLSPPTPEGPAHGKTRFPIADVDGNPSHVLGQNYPNPTISGMQVVIPFVVMTEEHVLLRLFNQLGQCVSKPVDGYVNTGAHTVFLSADDSGREFSPGVYYYSLTVGARTCTRRMIIVK